MEYTAVIRTLGTAGDKYQQLLDSLVAQTLRPVKIIVYIAEGYPLPKETVGVEEYVYVRKGMVAQRALRYDEVDTEYILFLDDDLAFPADFVERMYGQLQNEKADVVSPDIYQNDKRPFFNAAMMLLSGRMCARRDDGKWGYKVMRTTGFSYNRKPRKASYISQTNAGACFLCRKKDFISIHFQEELWLDTLSYSLGDDQVMYYKMYLYGLKVITWYDCIIHHLDAGGNTNVEKERNLIYSDFWFKTIFWHRFIFLPENNWLRRQWCKFCLGYSFAFTLIVSTVKGRFDILKLKISAIRSGIEFIRSGEYRLLPKVTSISRS